MADAQALIFDSFHTPIIFQKEDLAVIEEMDWIVELDTNGGLVRIEEPIQHQKKQK